MTMASGRSNEKAVVTRVQRTRTRTTPCAKPRSQRNWARLVRGSSMAEMVASSLSTPTARTRTSGKEKHSRQRSFEVEAAVDVAPRPQHPNLRRMRDAELVAVHAV